MENDTTTRFKTVVHQFHPLGSGNGFTVRFRHVISDPIPTMPPDEVILLRQRLNMKPLSTEEIVKLRQQFDASGSLRPIVEVPLLGYATVDRIEFVVVGGKTVEGTKDRAIEPVVMADEAFCRLVDPGGQADIAGPAPLSAILPHWHKPEGLPVGVKRHLWFEGIFQLGKPIKPYGTTIIQTKREVSEEEAALLEARKGATTANGDLGSTDYLRLKIAALQKENYDLRNIVEGQK